LNMLSGYTFNTHFESGIGIAVAGDIPSGPATIFKVSGDMSRSFCCSAELVRCQKEGSLCRTQAVLKVDDPKVCTDYFLTRPVGNHHIVFPGSYKNLFDTFIKEISLS